MKNLTLSDMCDNTDRYVHNNDRCTNIIARKIIKIKNTII